MRQKGERQTQEAEAEKRRGKRRKGEQAGWRGCKACGNQQESPLGRKGVIMGWGDKMSTFSNSSVSSVSKSQHPTNASVRKKTRSGQHLGKRH